MKHYSLQELDRYRHGDLGLLGTLSCRIHLRHCGECRKLGEQLADDDRFLQGVREATDSLTPFEGAGDREDQTLTRLEQILGEQTSR